MTIHDMESIQLIKEKYPTGTRILNKRLIDPFQNLDNMKGTVTNVDDMGGIHMLWDNGSTLALYENEDDFIIIDNLGILLELESGRIRHKQIDLPPKVELEKCYEVTNCRCIDLVSLDNSIDIIVDDEGLLKTGNFVSTIKIIGHGTIQLAGKLLFLGSDSEGNFIPLTTEQIEWISKNVRYEKYPKYTI